MAGAHSIRGQPITYTQFRTAWRRLRQLDQVGHIRAVGGGAVLCACGNVGCAGALASHRAVLRGLGIPEPTEDDPLYGTHTLAERVANNDPSAVRALPLATRKLTITTTQPGENSAIHGSVALALRDVFNEQGIARMLVDDAGVA
ncbi:ROK family protein [Streptomyces sp. NPDC000878]